MSKKTLPNPFQMHLVQSLTMSTSNKGLGKTLFNKGFAALKEKRRKTFSVNNWVLVKKRLNRKMKRTKTL